MHDFLDIHDGLMVSSKHIAAIEALDDYSSAIHVNFGSETRVFPKNIPYPVLRDIILSRNRAETPNPEPVADERATQALIQLAKYQTSPAW